MKLRLGFSTCPNDTFIFDAMVHHKIDTEGLEFDVLMADVEELNREAFNHSIDITKISYHAFAYISDFYMLLESGSALGNGNGPLLISKKEIELSKVDLLKIAIPGKHTTANLLLGIAFPKAINKTECLFSDIENLVINGEADAGLIIHENRFTYQQKGLIKLMDLGEFWENLTQLPIPLGGIAVNRKLPEDIRLKVNRIMYRSVEYAFANPKESYAFVREYAQEMNEEVMYNHINLYVNNYTLHIGDNGRKAVEKLYETAALKKIIRPITKSIFVQ